jgi:hypothetical protein
MGSYIAVEVGRRLGLRYLDREIIESVAREKGLQLLFSQADSGLVWADTGLDLTAEVIRRLDAASAAAPKPAPPKK